MGASPWWGLAVAASPGLLFSASGALTEPLQVALVCAALLVWGSPRAQPGLLAGLLVVRFLLNFVSQYGFTPFAWWRIIVGAGGLLALWLY